MKNGVLVAAASGVDALSKTPGFPVLTAFKIAKLNVHLRRTTEAFDGARMQLVGRYMDPMTGQPKLTATKNPDGSEGPLSPQPSFDAFNKEMAELLAQEVDFTIPEDLKLNWDDITANPNPLAPSRIETLYRQGFIINKPSLSGVAKKTLTNLSMDVLMNTSTALFVLGNQPIALNSLLTAVILENLSRIVPLGEAAIQGQMPEETATLEMLALDLQQLEQLNPAPTGEVLTALMSLI